MNKKKKFFLQIFVEKTPKDKQIRMKSLCLKAINNNNYNSILYLQRCLINAFQGKRKNFAHF